MDVHNSYLMRYLHTQRTISASFTFSYTVCISSHSKTAGPRQHSNIHDESICALALCFVNPAFVCQQDALSITYLHLGSDRSLKHCCVHSHVLLEVNSQYSRINAATVGFALADSGESEPGDTRRVISPRAICGSRRAISSNAIPVHWYRTTCIAFWSSRNRLVYSGLVYKLVLP